MDNFPEPVAALRERGWEFHVARNAVGTLGQIDMTDEPTHRAMGVAVEDMRGPRHIYFFQRNRDPLTGRILEDYWITPHEAAHEMGHAWNREIGHSTGLLLSDHPAFIKAHARDVEKMVEGTRDSSVYFIEPPHVKDPRATGRSETVAEMVGVQMQARRSTIGDTKPVVNFWDMPGESFGDKFPECAGLCWKNISEPFLLGQPMAQHLPQVLPAHAPIHENSAASPAAAMENAHAVSEHPAHEHLIGKGAKVVRKLGMLGGIAAGAYLTLKGEYAQAAAAVIPGGDSALALMRGNIKGAAISGMDEFTFGAASFVDYSMSKEAFWGSVSMNEIDFTAQEITAQAKMIPETINGQPAWKALRDPAVLDRYAALAQEKGDADAIAALRDFKTLEEGRQYKISLETPAEPAGGFKPKASS